MPQEACERDDTVHPALEDQDELRLWFLRQLQLHLGLDHCPALDSCDALDSFVAAVDIEDGAVLWGSVSGGGSKASAHFSPEPPRSCGAHGMVYFLRRAGGPLDRAGVSDAVASGAHLKGRATLEELAAVLKGAYRQVLTAEANQSGWSRFALDATEDVVSSLVRGFTISQGLTVGHTSISIPVVDSSSSDRREHIRRAEAAVVLWTVQITWLVDTRAESRCEPQNSVNYSVDSVDGSVEDMCGLETMFLFWEARSEELRLLLTELEDQRVNKIVALLDKVHSDAAHSFQEARIKLKDASRAADAVVEHMRWLKPIVGELQGAGSIEDASSVVKVLVHAIWLLWRHAASFGE